jgi:DNA repair protein RecO (recombination protein O)
MTELLYRSIPGEMADTGLFTYIAKSLEKLDSDEPFLKLFPLTFSLGLTAYLGFNPRNNYSEKEIIFDMQEGVFIPSLPVHHHFLAEPFSGYLAATLSGDEMKTDLISYPDRRLLLDKVMEYFRLHLGGFGEMKSIQVLGVVLND